MELLKIMIQLKNFFIKKIKFKSETDTEVLVQLIGYFFNQGKMKF